MSPVASAVLESWTIPPAVLIRHDRVAVHHGCPARPRLTGGVYLVLSILLALWFLWTAARFVHDRSLAAARRLLMASLVYLPALLAIMALDRHGR